MPRLLLVDDDTELCQMLAEYLGAEDFSIATAHDGDEGARLALAEPFDAIVLDVMMPRLNGLDALRRIRQQSQVPVVMLTAKGDDVDRIVGLELGADDYLAKPFNPRELVARLRAILRRAGTQEARAQGDILETGAMVVRPAERVAEWRGKPLELTSTEFSLLEVLVRHAGQVVGKSELFEQALGRPETRYDRSVDMHVSNLRHKIGPLDDGRSPIQTVRGIGYQFIIG